MILLGWDLTFVSERQVDKTGIQPPVVLEATEFYHAPVKLFFIKNWMVAIYLPSILCKRQTIQ